MSKNLKTGISVLAFFLCLCDRIKWTNKYSESTIFLYNAHQTRLYHLPLDEQIAFVDQPRLYFYKQYCLQVVSLFISTYRKRNIIGINLSDNSETLFKWHQMKFEEEVEVDINKILCVLSAMPVLLLDMDNAICCCNIILRCKFLNCNYT